MSMQVIHIFNKYFPNISDRVGCCDLDNLNPSVCVQYPVSVIKKEKKASEQGLEGKGSHCLLFGKLYIIKTRLWNTRFWNKTLHLNTFAEDMILFFISKLNLGMLFELNFSENIF